MCICVGTVWWLESTYVWPLAFAVTNVRTQVWGHHWSLYFQWSIGLFSEVLWASSANGCHILALTWRDKVVRFKVVCLGLTRVCCFCWNSQDVQVVYKFCLLQSIQYIYILVWFCCLDQRAGVHTFLWNPNGLSQVRLERVWCALIVAIAANCPTRSWKVPAFAGKCLLYSLKSFLLRSTNLDSWPT